MIAIEKEISIPVKIVRNKNWGSSIYPLKDMEVGDSFYVPKRINIWSIYCVAVKWAKKNNLDWKFVLRKENSGARLWRVDEKYVEEKQSAKSDFTIDKNIPISQPVTRVKYMNSIFSKLKVGESYYQEELTPYQLYQSFYRWKKYYNSPFMVITKEEKLGARLWRIK